MGNSCIPAMVPCIYARRYIRAWFRRKVCACVQIHSLIKNGGYFMKRIALFISSFQKGGSERVMAGLAVYFHEQKYDVILVTQYKKETEYNLPPEIRRVY